MSAQGPQVPSSAPTRAADEDLLTRLRRFADERDAEVRILRVGGHWSVGITWPRVPPFDTPTDDEDTMAAKIYRALDRALGTERPLSDTEADLHVEEHGWPPGWPKGSRAPSRAHAERGDEVEAWLKEHRDRFAEEGGESVPMLTPANIAAREAWRALDGALEDYRLHADCGTPLDEEVEQG